MCCAHEIQLGNLLLKLAILKNNMFVHIPLESGNCTFNMPR